jgi:hypothetical protein
VAQIGSALGRSFSHELIVAVTAMPQDKLNDALDQLVTAELIFRRGTPPDAEYTFKHALVQDAAYSTLLRSRLRRKALRASQCRSECDLQIQLLLLAQEPIVRWAVAAWMRLSRLHCNRHRADNSEHKIILSGLQRGRFLP